MACAVVDTSRDFAWLFCDFRCLFSKVPFLPPSWVPTILPQWPLRCCAASWYWCHLYACLLLFWLCSLTFVFVSLLVCCTAPRLGTVFVHVFFQKGCTTVEDLNHYMAHFETEWRALDLHQMAIQWSLAAVSVTCCCTVWSFLWLKSERDWDMRFILVITH